MGVGARHRSPWTEAEDKRLAFDWGVFNAHTIARRLGRSVNAVVWRAKTLRLGPPHRGTVTLGELERETGHHRSRVANAMRRLGIALQHVPSSRRRGQIPSKGRRTAIDPEDAERIREFLAKHPDGEPLVAHPASEWGVAGRPGCCEGCGRTDRSHFAHGWCEACYKRSGYWLRKLRRPRGSSYSLPTLTRRSA